MNIRWLFILIAVIFFGTSIYLWPLWRFSNAVSGELVQISVNGVKYKFEKPISMKSAGMLTRREYAYMHAGDIRIAFTGGKTVTCHGLITGEVLLFVPVDLLENGVVGELNIKSLKAEN